MSRNASADRVRRVQLAFLVLLAVAFAQVVWWVFDQAAFQRQSRERIMAGLEREREIAWRLLSSGDDDLEGLGRSLIDANPDLVSAGDGVAIANLAVASFERERRRRLNRYLWEGGFFLVVLVAGMAILWRALRQEAALRHRQENFLGAVSHELKSPLASLRLAAEAMARRELDRSQQERWLERSLGDLDRLETLVGNLLDSSRLESDRAQLSAEPVALREVVDEAIRGLAPDIGRDRVNNDVSQEVELLADRVAVLTVARNLIDNALKATEASGEIAVTASSDQEMVTLSVADSGSGFDPAETERLFDKFYRPGDELRRGQPGTGLGLYLVKRFAELGGGGVSAHSDGPGRGARFEVSWPRRRPKQAITVVGK